MTLIFIYLFIYFFYKVWIYSICSFCRLWCIFWQKTNKQTKNNMPLSSSRLWPFYPSPSWKPCGISFNVITVPQKHLDLVFTDQEETFMSSSLQQACFCFKLSSVQKKNNFVLIFVSNPNMTESGGTKRLCFFFSFVIWLCVVFSAAADPATVRRDTRAYLMHVHCTISESACTLVWSLRTTQRPAA